MIAPVLRLGLIYLVLIAAVAAVFNRDRLAQLWSRDPATATVSAASEGARTAPAAPTGNTAIAPPPAEMPRPAAPVATAAPADSTAPGAGAGNLPVYGSDLQSPVVEPAPQSPAGPAAPAGAPATPPAPPAPGAAPAAPMTTGAAPAHPADPARPVPALGAGDPNAVAAAVAQARAAYWSGDVEGARAQMQALAAAHPDNIDVAGELGNLDYALRDYPAAAKAYHRAGVLMIAAGQTPRAMSLLPVLRAIDPDMATDLAARAGGR